MLKSQDVSWCTHLAISSSPEEVEGRHSLPIYLVPHRCSAQTEYCNCRACQPEVVGPISPIAYCYLPYIHSPQLCAISLPDKFEAAFEVRLIVIIPLRYLKDIESMLDKMDEYQWLVEIVKDHRILILMLSQEGG